MIRVASSGICGTDVHIYHGTFKGDYPIVPGHEFSGVVEKCGVGVERISPGAKVAVEPNIACGNCPACLENKQNFCENWQAIGVTLPGGMAEYVVVPEKCVFPIHDLDFEIAAFMEPLSCVLHGLEKLNIEPGITIAVMGAGPIGLQFVRSVRALGAGDVSVVEKNLERLSFVEKDGIATAADRTDELSSDLFDVIIDTTGVPALVPEAMRLVRPGGEILLFGVADQGAHANFDQYMLFEKGISIHGSFTSKRNSLQAVRLLSQGLVRVDDLISHRLPLSQFSEGIHLIERGAESVMKIMISP